MISYVDRLVFGYESKKIKPTSIARCSKRHDINLRLKKILAVVCPDKDADRLIEDKKLTQLWLDDIDKPIPEELLQRDEEATNQIELVIQIEKIMLSVNL